MVLFDDGISFVNTACNMLKSNNFATTITSSMGIIYEAHPHNHWILSDRGVTGSEFLEYRNVVTVSRYQKIALRCSVAISLY